MFQQEPSVDALPPSSMSQPPTACTLDWIDSWGFVREDICELLAAYQQADGGHDVGRFQSLLDDADGVLRLLRHRVEWLRNHLDPAPDRAAERC